MDRPEWTYTENGTPILHIYTDEQADSYVQSAMSDKPNWALWLVVGLVAAMILKRK